MTKGVTKPSHSAGPPSTVTWLAAPSSVARASMYARSAASTPPVSAKTVCTAQPRSRSQGMQKLVSRPPEKARTMALSDMFVSLRAPLPSPERGWGEGGGFGCLFPQQRRHHRLLHMQAVLGLVDGDAARGIHDRVGGLDVPAQRQAVAEDGVIGHRHLGL